MTGPAAGDPAVTRALADTEPRVYWTDRSAPDPRPPVERDLDTDLAVVGGGFTGLWAAIHAKQDDPSRAVVLLEQASIGWGASGRNGGFVNATLTHGLANGERHFPAELPTLVQMGHENWCGMLATLAEHGLGSAVEPVGKLSVATEEHHLRQLQQALALFERHGEVAAWLDRDAVRDAVASPTYLAGVALRSANGLTDPAALAWGLADVAERLGVDVRERTAVEDVSPAGAGVALGTAGLGGRRQVRAARVVLATGAYGPLVRRVRAWVVPLHEQVLVTEPLTPTQRAALRWEGRQGVTDSVSHFHYYRLTPDQRILWGGDTVAYRFGGRHDERLEHTPAVRAKLAASFFRTFPQLRGVRFSHGWGGPIDSTTRFTPAWGTALDGRAAWVAGYTGLGVAASRFGARVALDLVDGLDTERTRLRFVRRRPWPFPPEPLRWMAVEATRRSLLQSDSRGGRRNLWLRLLDRAGVGFST